MPVEDVLRFEQALLDYLRHNTGVLTEIAETKKFSDEAMEQTKQAIVAVKQGFRTSEGKLLVGHEEFEAIDEDEIDQEVIVRQKRG